MSGRENGLIRGRLHSTPDKWLSRPAGGVQSPAAVAGYIFAHAGRQIRLGPVAFWIFVGTVVIMAGWTIATATYFAFRDDLLKGLIVRQAEQQNAYEDRIAELRARIDRTTSRQLLDQEQFEQKLDDLMRRQSTLESRATALGGIADPVVTGAIKPRNSQLLPVRPASPQARDRRSALEPDRAAVARRAGKRRLRINAKLSGVEASLDRLDHRQALGARATAGALRRQGATTARRACRSWPQTRWTSAGRKRRPIRPDQVAGRRQ